MLAANLHKFKRLSRDERRLFVQAILFLPVIHLGLIVLGYSRLRRVMEKLASLDRLTTPGSELEVLARGEAIARMTAIAAKYGFYQASCLRKALFVWWLLRREGIRSKICFGVRIVDQKLEAHAWVEYRGIVVNDAVDVYEQYHRLQDMLPSTRLGL